MKIIFLDFDGPLSNNRTYLATGDTHPFDPLAVRILRNICVHNPDFKIVCTSVRTWAHSRASFQTTRDHFAAAGLGADCLHPTWSCRTDDGLREDHIRAFLKAHPEVTHYAIIDDDYVDLPQFIHVTSEDGILTQHIQQLADILDVRLHEVFAETAKENGSFRQYLLPYDSWMADWNARLEDGPT